MLFSLDRGGSNGLLLPQIAAALGYIELGARKCASASVVADGSSLTTGMNVLECELECGTSGGCAGYSWVSSSEASARRLQQLTGDALGDCFVLAQRPQGQVPAIAMSVIVYCVMYKQDLDRIEYTASGVGNARSLKGGHEVRC